MCADNLMFLFEVGYIKGWCALISGFFLSMTELTGATGEERSSEDDGSVDNSAKRQKLAGIIREG